MIYIKKITLGLIGAFVFYGLAFTVMQFSKARAVDGDLVTPVTPPNEQGLATGGVKAKLDDLTLKLDFNAHQSPLKGKVNYSDSSGKNFKGDVDVCYFQSGNEAAFAGTVGKGSVIEKYFVVQVQDNGEGKNSSPDMLSVSFTDTTPTCTLGTFDAEVTNGNLQVHPI